MKILFIGGTFDNNNGKPSGLIKKIYDELNELMHYYSKIDFYNGGSYEALNSLLTDNLKNYDVIILFADIPNDLNKIREIKTYNKTVLLVTSKRNNKEYTFMDLLAHALSLKSNLVVEFDQTEMPYKMRLFDPLGNIWQETDDHKLLTLSLVKQIVFLTTVKRQGVSYVDEIVNVPIEKEFFSYIRKCADIFYELTHPVNTTRFLGNSSFRCTKSGFPSFKTNEQIFVSKRNVDKRFIDEKSFVPVKLLDDDTIIYYKSQYGNSKPSVDTPIQLRLYKYYHKVRYMVHSHVYIKDVLYIKQFVPCGGLQEFEEIISLISNKNTCNFAVNLIGHGSIILTDNVNEFSKFDFISRNLPERQY